MMRLARLALILAAALLVGAPAVPTTAEPIDGSSPAAELTAAQKANVHVLDGVLEAVRKQFYDRDFCGLKLADLRAKYLDKVTASKPGQPLHAVLNAMIAEFKVSHFVLVEDDVYNTYFAPEFNNTFSARPGFEIARIGGEYFVAALTHGGAAEKAGVLRGDRIVKVNGEEIANSELLVDGGTDPGIPGGQHLVLRVPDTRDPVLKLDIQRRRTDKALKIIEIKPTSINQIMATRDSVAVIEHKGKKLGYIRLWHVLHEAIAQTLSAAIRKDWKDCDGLILDLRGRGGNVNVMNACFEPFGAPPPQRDRRGFFRPQRFGMPKWNKPVVALTDSGSRSAKEVYAHNWKYLEIGPIVGETTAGAVLGSNFARMPDNSQLLLPVMNVQTLTYGNQQLEGSGVVPTHPIKDLVAYAEGGDIIKETGIKVLMGEIKKRPAKKPEPEPQPVEPEDTPEEQFSR
ncbi:MAG: PDZ domain-containing protein [Planctomycetes bacterium]|nr:PDZ domain-containing protein [Planctomycetota bacterium]